MAKQKAKKPRRILCYIDLSKSSRYILEYAKQIADLTGADVYYLHSVTYLSKFAGFYVPHMSTDNLSGEMMKGAKDKLYAICMQTIGEVDASRRILKEGDPVDAINEEIERLGTDLLIIGHEYKTFSFFKEDYVTRYLKDPICPVLVIPLSGELQLP
jgi:nucleotide-binding universal stress UspA family protein